jgi:glutamine amidotransferase
MCRFAAFAGTKRTLASLLYDPPHALEHQSYAPQRLHRGHVNVDGTGVVWWPDGGADPLRYVSERPPWSDPNLPLLGRRLEATTAVAAVRSATPGIGFGPGHVQPFLADGVAFAHNGWIDGWRAGVGRDLIDLLPDELHSELDIANDSKAIFLHAIALLRGGADPTRALAASARLVSDLADARDQSATLTMCIVTAGRLVAIRTAVRSQQNTLFWSAAESEVRIASEPLEPDGSWAEVPEDHVVDARPDGTQIVPIEAVS